MKIMRKCISLIIVGLIILCVIEANASPLNQENYVIESSKPTTSTLQQNTTNLSLSITGGIGVTTKIKNMGDFSATNVTTKLIITGGIFNSINIIRDGPYVVPLLPNETLERGAFPIGFGLITIDMTVSADNAVTVTKSVEGIILLFFVIIK
jgi:hypothetical protein